MRKLKGNAPWSHEAGRRAGASRRPSLQPSSLRASLRAQPSSPRVPEQQPPPAQRDSGIDVRRAGDYNAGAWLRHQARLTRRAHSSCFVQRTLAGTASIAPNALRGKSGGLDAIEFRRREQRSARRRVYAPQRERQRRRGPWSVTSRRPSCNDT